jgi:hypothetical protein
MALFLTRPSQVYGTFLVFRPGLARARTLPIASFVPCMPHLMPCSCMLLQLRYNYVKDRAAKCIRSRLHALPLRRS